MSIQPLGFANAKSLNRINFGNKNINSNYTTQPYPQDSVEINVKKKVFSNAQKLRIGFGMAALPAKALSFCGKIGAAQEGVVKLAEHIDFTPAKTTQEAIEFAKTKLGVKNYDDSMSLDVMNWVNEGLTNINNVRKGKAKLFDTIRYDLINSSYLCYVDNNIEEPKLGAILNISKKHTKKMGKYINLSIDFCIDNNILYRDENKKILLKPFYNCGKVSDHFIEKLNKFNDNPSSFSLIDRVELNEYFNLIWNKRVNFFKSPYLNLKQILKNESIQETLLAHSKLPDLKQIEKLPALQRKNVLEDIINNYIDLDQGIHLDYPAVNTLEIIYHENGHLEHHLKIGKDKFLSMGKLEECMYNLGKISDITFDFIFNVKKQEIANSISNYASESPLEFVAEVYKKLINKALGGKEQISDDVMKLYNEYGGPAI